MGRDSASVKTYCVNLIYTLLAFITLAFHPVSVQISEQSVKIIGAGCVPIPLARVVP